MIGDVDTALDHLPEIYARYFALRRQGVGREAMAERLGIPAESLDTFIELAHAKLTGVDIGCERAPTHRR